MKGFVGLLLAIGLAVVCWGVYGPTLNEGRADMGGSSLRPFICVGLAYFLIAVLLPGIWLYLKGEVGHWSATGIIWSMAAGAAGAIGALGVILALAFHGSPVYVMPLVFGCAPVVNTFLTMYWTRSFRQMSSIFIAGLILVIVGAVTVLIFRPHGHAPPEATVTAQADGAAPVRPQIARESPVANYALVMLFTALTAVSWGAYGPTLHRGQMGMAGSRLRPLICVGMSYFLIAVIVPSLLLTQWSEPGEFTVRGSIWSMLGGATGGLGALGIIMAFNSGGKPVFVMPLVFGGAPVVNTFVSVTQSGSWGQLHAMFYAGLIVVVAGAMTVLVFSPKPAPHAAGSQSPTETAHT
jgi:drug/metabolite transporter (DMT)-like permease